MVYLYYILYIYYNSICYTILDTMGLYGIDSLLYHHKWDIYGHSDNIVRYTCYMMGYTSYLYGYTIYMMGYSNLHYHIPINQ